MREGGVHIYCSSRQPAGVNMQAFSIKDHKRAEMEPRRHHRKHPQPHR
jgi:hypothetical protein